MNVVLLELGQHTSVREDITLSQLKLAAVSVTVRDNLLDLGLLDGPLPSGEEFVIVEEVLFNGPLLSGNGHAETAEHPNEVGARLYKQKVVLGMVEFGREFPGYERAADAATDDDHVLLRG